MARAIDQSTAERKLLYSSKDSSDDADVEGPHILSEGKDPIVELVCSLTKHLFPPSESEVHIINST
jgi:hypothetical protein